MLFAGSGRLQAMPWDSRGGAGRPWAVEKEVPFEVEVMIGLKDFSGVKRSG